MQGYNLLAVRKRPGWIEKYLDVPAGTRAEESLETRYAELVLYERTLRELGVHVPQTSITTDAVNSRVVVESVFVEGKNAFKAIEEGSRRDVEDIVRLVAREAILVAASMSSARPVGCDSALSNFIISEGSGDAVLVDITPPRLMFNERPGGPVELIPYARLRVNYPEKRRLTRRYERTIRRYYYTPQGTIEHLFAWCVTAGTYLLPRAEQEWRALPHTHAVQRVLADEIEKRPSLVELRGVLAVACTSQAFARFMERRIAKARQAAEAV